jgi:hypothetical protein
MEATAKAIDITRSKAATKSLLFCMVKPRFFVGHRAKTPCWSDNQNVIGGARVPRPLDAPGCLYEIQPTSRALSFAAHQARLRNSEKLMGTRGSSSSSSQNEQEDHNSMFVTGEKFIVLIIFPVHDAQPDPRKSKAPSAQSTH